MRNIMIILVLFPWGLSGQSAFEIVQKSDQKMRGKSSKGTTTIQIVRPKYTREMKMVNWTLGDDYALVLILEPKKDEGSAFLKRENEIWNWVPNIERTIKLPPSMMTQNWMGTDFTNDDLVKQSSLVVDYTHEIVSEEKVNGLNCWKIELTPKPDAAVVWGKILIWIDKADFMQMKVEFYDEDDFLINTLSGSDPKEFDGQRLPSRLEMIPAEKPGNKTVMITNTLDFNIEVSEAFFTTRNMQSVKFSE